MLIRRGRSIGSTGIKALFVHIVAIAIVLAIPIIIFIGKVLAAAAIVYILLCLFK